MTPIDEALLHKLSRQLRLLNFLLIFCTLITISLFAVAGFFGYQAMRQITSAKKSLDSIQGKTTDSLNVQNDLCNSTGMLSSLIKSQSEICN